jgi:hypothetical protein
MDCRRSSRENWKTITRKTLRPARFHQPQRHHCESTNGPAAIGSFKEHDSKHTGLLASFAGGLSLDMMGRHGFFDQNQKLRNHHSSAISSAALLSKQTGRRRFQPAIRETPTCDTRPTRVKCPEFTEIVICLLSLDNIAFSCERNIAIRTALHLSNIVGRPQIYQSVRRAQADTGELGPKGMVNRLAEICSAYRPKKSGPSPRASGSKRITSLSTPSTA